MSFNILIFFHTGVFRILYSMELGMILLFSAQFSTQRWSTQAHHPTVNSSDKTHQRCVSLLTHTDPQPLTNMFICREVLEAAGGDG